MPSSLPNWLSVAGIFGFAALVVWWTWKPWPRRRPQRAAPEVRPPRPRTRLRAEVLERVEAHREAERIGAAELDRVGHLYPEPRSSAPS